jgi:hypothetical protein
MMSPVGVGGATSKPYFKGGVEEDRVQSSLRRNDVLVVPARVP